MSGESAFEDDDDDLEFQELLRGEPLKTIELTSSKQIPTNLKSKKYLPQRTLAGFIVPKSPTIQFEEAPTLPSVSNHHKLDTANLGTYIYPTNFEVRDYQFNIAVRSLYENVLAALPTGLGKTFIASVVMLNYLRWFPDLKIVFMAPTRPLVAQQIKACCSTTGIPTSKVAILLDKTRKNREEIWDLKQVFFTTPQVVENDLTRGIVDPKSIVLLIVDEAHRAKGNYAYNNVVKFMKRFNSSFRILALTATPASDVEGVQEIVDNLMISKIEVRTEKLIDIIKYMNRKKVVRRVIPQSTETLELIGYLSQAIEPTLIMANEKKIYEVRDPLRINSFHCMETSRRLMLNKSIPEGVKWSSYFVLQLLGTVGQCLRRLNIYGISSFYSYFKEKHLEFTTKWKKKKSKNKTNADFYFADLVNLLLERAEEIMKSPTLYSHPKIEAIMEELEEFFTEKDIASSKVIIFTEFRESALEIVQEIEKFGKSFKPHIFIGQSKEKDKFSETKKKTKEPKGKQSKSNIPNTRTSSEDAQINGMNQKLQKEIVKKFKDGEYNILVATSIGEEGLDIGEVDLIICYDSTSSPIKNVQRMGRTGRRRDGKVVLLFSSNEETKFDKAMAGYEYIQQHIMQSNLVTLAAKNRIIPMEFEPKVDMQLIEFPEENVKFDEVEDEDEIIRIATQYMLETQKKGKQKKATQTKGKKKQQKKFFMPDGVESGFRSVTSMIIGEPGDPVRQPDILDSILDSDVEVSMTSAVNKSLDEPYQERADGEQDAESIPEVQETTTYAANTNQRIPAIQLDTTLNARIRQRSIPLDDEILPVKKRGSLGVKRRIPEIHDQADIDSSVELTKASPSLENFSLLPGRRGYPLQEHSNTASPEYSSATQVRQQQDPSYLLPLSKPSPKSESITVALPLSSDEDFFDDGLDEELAMISSDKLPSFDSSLKKEIKPDEQQIAKIFSSREGLLDEDQLMELYTAYYTGIESSVRYYDPINGIKSDGSLSSGKIGHSKLTNRITNHFKFSKQLTMELAKTICKTHNETDQPLETECLAYLNSKVIYDK